LNDQPTLSDIKSDIGSLQFHIERLEALVQNRITPEYMTIKETAEYMRISVSKVRQLIDQGYLKSMRIGAGQTSKLILSRLDIDNYLRGTV
jgi:excisionase family DNA binding protein